MAKDDLVDKATNGAGSGDAGRSQDGEARAARKAAREARRTRPSATRSSRTSSSSSGRKHAGGSSTSSSARTDEPERGGKQAMSEREHEQSPTAFHAGVYSSVRAYLDAALAAGTNDAQSVIRKLKEKPIDDDLFGPVVVRPDGRAIHKMYILKVKAPASSRGKWDLLEQVGVLTGTEAFRPLEEGGCSLVEPSKNN